MTPPVARLAAFTDVPTGGNPAGVVLADRLPEAATMQRLAAEVGYSETAFLAPAGEGAFTVRYFAPEAEVPFCGHATIAAGVLLGERHGPGHYRFETPAGPVAVDVTAEGGTLRASLTSVEPRLRAVADEDLAAGLAAFGWTRDDLDPGLPPLEAYAGAWHLIVAVRDRSTLAGMRYVFDDLRRWMTARDLTTVQAVWREDAATFHARGPFPVGGVVEDPATGAAAAALGGYLRLRDLVEAPATVTVHQGVDLGRPSVLTVDIPAHGGIRVSGTAVHLTAEASRRVARAAHRSR